MTQEQQYGTQEEQHDAEMAAGFAAAGQARDTNSEHDPDPEITTGRSNVAAMEDHDAKWEQRYRALEGKYRAEVPRLAEQLKSIQAQLEEAQLAKPANAETGQRAEPPPEVLAFQEEFPTHSAVMDFKAQEAAKALVEAETAHLREELAQERATREELARSAHFMAIGAAHRDWQELLPDINAWAANLSDPEDQAKVERVLNGGTAIDVVDLY